MNDFAAMLLKRFAWTHGDGFGEKSIRSENEVFFKAKKTISGSALLLLLEYFLMKMP